MTMEVNISITGPEGSGKTTVANAVRRMLDIHGFTTKPKEGRITSVDDFTIVTDEKTLKSLRKAIPDGFEFENTK